MTRLSKKNQELNYFKSFYKMHFGYFPIDLIQLPEKNGEFDLKLEHEDKTVYVEITEHYSFAKDEKRAAGSTPREIESRRISLLSEIAKKLDENVIGVGIRFHDVIPNLNKEAKRVLAECINYGINQESIDSIEFYTENKSIRLSSIVSKYRFFAHDELSKNIHYINFKYGGTLPIDSLNSAGYVREISSDNILDISIEKSEKKKEVFIEKDAYRWLLIVAPWTGTASFFDVPSAPIIIDNKSIFSKIYFSSGWDTQEIEFIQNENQSLPGDCVGAA